MAVSLEHPDKFVQRHVGPSSKDTEAMLAAIGAPSLDALVAETVPESIRLPRPLALTPAKSEHALLEYARELGKKNRPMRSFIGMGYSDCVTPPVILRNVLENPGWYTQYTPYQAEIAQGRLEALLNFQTMVMDLTGLEVANASLLDEATAAAEAMTMRLRVQGRRARQRLLRLGRLPPADDRRRADARRGARHRRRRGVSTIAAPSVANLGDLDRASKAFGVLLQYPASDGAHLRYRASSSSGCMRHGGLVVVAADILALALLTPPGELGADIAVGSTQRFGVPLGYGGPHAAYFATQDEFKRKIPGRIIGVSRRRARQARPPHGAPDARAAHPPREGDEQHLHGAGAARRHGRACMRFTTVPKGSSASPSRVHALTATLAQGLEKLGLQAHARELLRHGARRGVRTTTAIAAWRSRCRATINLRRIDGDDRRHQRSTRRRPKPRSTTLLDDLRRCGRAATLDVAALADEANARIPEALARKSRLPHPPRLQRHHSETEMLRYIRKLEARDLSLTHSMIPLGSCTMKLNATAEMLPGHLAARSERHPSVRARAIRPRATQTLFQRARGDALAEITGFPAVSLQPNAGSQGEYAGLLVIRKYHETPRRGAPQRLPDPAVGARHQPGERGDGRDEVVVVETRRERQHRRRRPRSQARRSTRSDLAALMVTYPSTHGVFEEDDQARSATSSTRTAARSTWTAPT